MMRRASILVLLALVVCQTSCGQSDARWEIHLRAPGRTEPYALPATIVLFEPDAEPRLLHLAPSGLHFYSGEDAPWASAPGTYRLPPLERGYYELWLPGCRPVRVDAKPTAPIVVMPGYPVDVTWRKDAPFEQGAAIHVKATWRGAGDHPEAIIRAAVPAGAPEPGSQTAEYVRFVDGILIDPTVGTGRFYVPWPGAYRVTFGTGRYQISQTANTFSASGGGSWSPGDGTSVVVPADGSPVVVELPRR